MVPRARHERRPICPTSDYSTALEVRSLRARSAPNRRLRHFLKQGQPFPDPLAVLSEIIMAVPRPAVDRNARTIRSEWNELDRDDVGKAKCRRMLDVNEPSVIWVGRNRLDALLARYHFCPIFAQSLPWHREDRAGDRFARRAISRRTEEKARFRQRRVQFGKADCLARSQAIFGFPAHIDPHGEPECRHPQQSHAERGQDPADYYAPFLPPPLEARSSLCHNQPLGKGADRNGSAISAARSGGSAARMRAEC